MNYRYLNKEELSLVKELVKKEFNQYILGLFIRNQLIGFIALKSMSEIEYIYIHEDYRHQNLATFLLNKAIYMMNHEIHVNDLSCKEFFIKNGFVEENDCLIYQHHFPIQFQSYDQLSQFISQQKDRVYSLDNYKNMMNEILNPQLLLNTIHVGGTNGKGSTTNYIHTVLCDHGYQCGMFTSPALHSRLEIIRINNQIISEDEILVYANRYINLWLKYSISMYEIEVFIGIMYFLHHHVDFALFEVGLGGEFDATNIIQPLVSLITNIGMDHKEYLGDTYEKIAQTKAGIIKNQTPFFTSEDKKVCLDIFKEVTRNKCCNMTVLDQCEHIEMINNQLHFDYKNYRFVLDNQALYQVKNSALAFEVIQFLKQNLYIDIENQSILKSMKHAKWNARFETISIKPHIIIDGAHNKEGIDAFILSAKDYKNKKIIFSALKDKDTDYMISQLLTICDDVTVCEFDFYRAQSAEILAGSYPVSIVKDFKKAIDYLKDYDGTIFITGSLYFIAQVREYILKQ